MKNRIISKIKNSFDLISLGDGFLNKLKIFSFITKLFIDGKLKKERKPTSFKIKINNNSVKLHLSGIHPEILMMHEIFIEKEYDVHSDIEVKSIIDLGGNIGLSTIYFATKYPEAKIITVEPDPNTFEILKKNAEQFENVEIKNAAVSNKEEQDISFFRHPVRHLASSLYRRTKNDEEIKVPTVKLENILGDGVDVLKFDIEGAEFDVFREFSGWNKIKYIAGETHNDLVEKGKDYDLVNVLEKNFDLVHTGNPKFGRAVFYGKRKN